MYELRTFGGLSLEANGAPCTGAAAQRKTLALLALLACHPRGLSRDKLIAYLWPETDAAHGRSLLRQGCYALRRDLGAADLVLGSTELRLNPAVLTSDVQRFEDALRGAEYERAARAYTGPFLDGFFVSDVGDFERWVEAERERLAHAYNDALNRLATTAGQRGDHGAAAQWWRLLVALDPLSSRASLGLMTALAAAGETAEALRHAQSYEELVRQELNAPLDPSVTALIRRLHDVPQEQARPEGTAAGMPERSIMDRLFLKTLDAVTTDKSRHPILRLWPQLAVLGVLLLGGALIRSLRPAIQFDSSLVAVAPFDVLAMRNPELWREGLVDVLSRNLDGAGSLRTVSPTVVIRRWQGHADPTSAARLAAGTRARFVVYGQVLGEGADSVHVRVAVLDAQSDRPLVEIDRSDQADRIDRLSDSLTLDMIRAVTPTVLGNHVRLHSVGTRSLPALKAFLRGERFLRHFSLDSAIANYDRAVALDTTFALALDKLQMSLGWNDSGPTIPGYYAARAAAFNHGLSARDSLLIALSWMAAPPQITTLEDAVRRYPEDPRFWYALGESRFHGGFYAGRTWYDARTAFDRVIALDSGFAPAYIHPITIALNDNDRDAALLYVKGYLASSPDVPEAGGIRLLSRLLAPDERAPDFTRELQRASPPALFHLALMVQSWPDPDETQIQVARWGVAMSKGRLRETRPDSGNDLHVYPSLLATTLIYRGRLREARAVVGRRYGTAFMELAELGAVSEAKVEEVLGAWLTHPDPLGFSFIPWIADGPCHRTQAAALWWAERRDTVSLRRLARREELAARTYGNGTVTDGLHPIPGFANAALLLAKGDSALALRRFLSVADSLCPDAAQLREIRFRLLAARGRRLEAAAVFDRSHDRRVPLMLERARLAERLRDPVAAIHYYQFVVQAWLHADEGLQPVVAEARAALHRLGGEPR